MRLYIPKGCRKFWIEFRDPNGIVQRWGLGTTAQDVADITKSQISSLNEWAMQGLPPPKDLLRWANNQKPKLYDKMLNAGILGTLCDYNYKPAPTKGTPFLQLQNVPYRSGVYFAFNNNKVVYVGKSKNLLSRIKPGHKKIKKSDDIAWIEYPVRLLDFAESFYIGTCRPERNFGSEQTLDVQNELMPKIE